METYISSAVELLTLRSRYEHTKVIDDEEIRPGLVLQINFGEAVYSLEIDTFVGLVYAPLFPIVAARQVEG